MELERIFAALDLSADELKGGARRGMLLQREKVTGRDFHRQIYSTTRGDRHSYCRIRTGFAFDRHICYATGDRKWSSGESQFSAADSREAITEEAGSIGKLPKERPTAGDFG